jgi:hypothetical protein
LGGERTMALSAVSVTRAWRLKKSTTISAFDFSAMFCPKSGTAIGGVKRAGSIGGAFLKLRARAR